MPISFPGLFGDWSWNPDPIAIPIGHGIYWYGIILAAAMLCGMYFSMRQAPRFGLTEDHISDMVLWAVPCCILGSRTYYVLFNLDFYRNADGTLNWGRIVAVWDGGIAMYGTVLMGLLVAYVFARRHRIPFGALLDTAAMGLLLGQAIGRWANLINREAFGAATTLPWRMRLWYNSNRYMEVHPTFFYESMWSLLGVFLMWKIVARGRRFDGENACFYFLWYGTGRFWIEGLRTDSLYLFNVTLLGKPVRVSQVLSLLAALAAIGVLYYELRVRKRTADGLYVNRLAAERENAETADSVEASDGAEPPEEAAPEKAELPGDLTVNAEAPEVQTGDADKASSDNGETALQDGEETENTPDGGEGAAEDTTEGGGARGGSAGREETGGEG